MGTRPTAVRRIQWVVNRPATTPALHQAAGSIAPDRARADQVLGIALRPNSRWTAIARAAVERVARAVERVARAVERAARAVERAARAVERAARAESPAAVAQAAPAAFPASAAPTPWLSSTITAKALT